MLLKDIIKFIELYKNREITKQQLGEAYHNIMEQVKLEVLKKSREIRVRGDMFNNILSYCTGDIPFKGENWIKGIPINFTIKRLRFQYIPANRETQETYELKIVDNITKGTNFKLVCENTDIFHRYFVCREEYSTYINSSISPYVN